MATRIHERSEGGVQVLDVDGPLTYADGASLLRTRIKGLIQGGYTQLLVNVGGVPYLDSAGLGELVQAHVTTVRQGGALKLVNATRRLRDLLVMTKLMTVLESFDDEAAAVASFHDHKST
jgi:anti-sigma B factor antagonist